MAKFHYKDGWFFERLEDGSVRITRENSGVELDIDPSSWASIVASVTPAGDNAETFRKAEELHRGE